MRNRKTEIVPTYVGAFVPSEQLFAAIEKRGRLADVNRLLGELQSKVPKLLHVTLSFIGSRISPKVQTELARAIDEAALARLNVSVTAIAFDPADRKSKRLNSRH